MDSFGEEGRIFAVVVNDDEQFSIWLAETPLPAGWRGVGVSGSKETCLSHIAAVWTDIRPASERRSQSTEG